MILLHYLALFLRSLPKVRPKKPEISGLECYFIHNPMEYFRVFSKQVFDGESVNKNILSRAQHRFAEDTNLAYLTTRVRKLECLTSVLLKTLMETQQNSFNQVLREFNNVYNYQSTIWDMIEADDFKELRNRERSHNIKANRIYEDVFKTYTENPRECPYSEMEYRFTKLRAIVTEENEKRDMLEIDGSYIKDS